MDTNWNDVYPARESIRAEVETMRQAYTNAIVASINHGLRDIFFKGSALKPWDSLVDYVPELSDIDLHVWLEDDVQISWTLEEALNVQARAENEFFAAHPQAIHVPRVQVNILNDLLSEPYFCGSLEGTTRSLLGHAYPMGSLDLRRKCPVICEAKE